VLAHSILGYLEKINQEDNVTILCSLHFLDLVQRYASKVIGLREGRLVFEGDSEDIRQMSDERFREIYGEEAERLGA
jgi:phosphonate transport system ATP-binding protein